MGQVLTQDNIPTLVKASTTTLTLATTNNGSPTRITIGGQQYAITSLLTLTTGGTGANGLDTGSLSTYQLWYVYAIVNNSSFAPALVASLSAPSSGPTMPSGYGTTYKLVGAFYTDSSSLVGSPANITGPVMTEWMTATSVFLSGGGTAPTKGTGAGYFDQLIWRRNGDSMDFNLIYKNGSGGAAGTGTAGYFLQIPAGFTLDTTKQDWSNSQFAVYGTCYIFDGVNEYLANVAAEGASPPSLAFYTVRGYGGSQANFANFGPTSLSGSFATNAMRIACKVSSLPIAGWKSTLL